MRADVEKVQGLPGINQLYGVEQDVGKYVRLRAGVEKAQAYGRDWAPYAGVEVGTGEGWAIWLNGSANSFKGADIKQGQIGAGVRIGF